MIVAFPGLLSYHFWCNFKGMETLSVAVTPSKCFYLPSGKVSIYTDRMSPFGANVLFLE